VFTTRRFAAVLFLGGVGFAVAMLFVLQGAPDLALTQLLIETLSLVIFMLVLRHLPDRFAPQPFRRRPGRARGPGRGSWARSCSCSLSWRGRNRTLRASPREHLARAYPEADGRNVVNVILVDFRALDTLGEIVVLVVAAIGIASLVLAARLDRPPSFGRAAEARAEPPMSSLILETATRATCSTRSSCSALFLLFAGHNQPGGGFIGGLMAAAAIVLRYSRGPDDLRRLIPVAPETLLGQGCSSPAPRVAGLLGGGAFLGAAHARARRCPSSATSKVTRCCLRHRRVPRRARASDPRARARHPRRRDGACGGRR
jgi:multicomponent Na+:H+ antiporter subunit A